jgi:hypothetical protein
MTHRFICSDGLAKAIYGLRFRSQSAIAPSNAALSKCDDIFRRSDRTGATERAAGKKASELREMEPPRKTALGAKGKR